MSKNSVNKEGYVQKELKMALDIVDEKPEGTIFLIPFLLDDCVIPNRLKSIQYVDRNKSDYSEKLLAALDLRARSIEKKQPVSSDTKFILDQLPKHTPVPEKPIEQKESSDNKEVIVSFFNSVGIRFISVLAGLFAAFTLRSISDNYYQPGDPSLLSTIAELIANSDFTFVLLILIAMAGSGYAIHRLDSENFDKIEMPVWLRYLMSIPTGYLTGAFVYILAVLFIGFIIGLVIPLLIIIVVLAGIVFFIWIESQGGSRRNSQPPSVEIMYPNNNPPKSPRVVPFEHLYKLNRKSTSGFRTLGKSESNDKRISGFRILAGSNKHKNTLYLGRNNCINCNGTGKEMCFMCQGKGTVGGRTCSVCRGKKTQKCLVCDGSGKV